MNRDIAYNLLIIMNMNELQKACLIDKHFLNIGQSKFFWIDKFKYDHLVIINKQLTINEWIKEYNKVNYATREAEIVIYNCRNMATLSISLPKKVMSKLPDFIIEWTNYIIVGSEDIIIAGENQEYKLTFPQFKYLLLIILYYNPEQEITDIDDWDDSYRELRF